jgi:hypothetical protein
MRSTCTHLLASPRLSLLLGLLLVSMILLFLFTHPRGRTFIVLYVDDMLIMGMILTILPLLSLVLVSSFTSLT